MTSALLVARGGFHTRREPHPPSSGPALAGHHSSVRSAQTNLARRSGPRPGSVLSKGIRQVNGDAEAAAAALKAPLELFHRRPGSSPVRAASRLSASLRRAAARAWNRPAPAREAPPTRKRWELYGQAKTPTPAGDRCSPCANRPLRLRRRGIVSGDCQPL